jgi:hypothetical protein
MENRTLAEIIRLCVEEESQRNNAFTELLRRLRVRVHRHVLTDEVWDWFGSWLFADLDRPNHRLGAALKALRNQCSQRECEVVADREEHVERYLRRVIQTAVMEFNEERGCAWWVTSSATTNEPEERDSLQALLDSEANNCATTVLQQMVRDSATEENQNHRIPFWLRYIRLCGPLLQHDVDFLTRTRADAADVIKERLRSVNEHVIHPFDGELIAYLMDVSRATIDTRISRARLRVCQRVRRRLGIGQESDVGTRQAMTQILDAIAQVEGM